MKKIFTIRNAYQQQAFLWDNNLIEEEVQACEHRNIKVSFVSYLPKDEKILEAGCGLGAWVIYLSGQGYHIEGIDNNGKVIQRLKTWNPELMVAQGDIEHLPYADDTLGAYISLGVLEHFEEGPERSLQEALRVLKPGGLLFLAVPYNNLFRKCIAHNLRSLYLWMYKMSGKNIHFAEYRFTEREARKMIEKAGFSIVEVGMDDFIAKTRSLTLWSEFPFLRDYSRLYQLNAVGAALSLILNSISRKLLASGVFVIAKKLTPAASVPVKGHTYEVAGL
jgi:SAM-dependent methyltransferase